MTIHSFIHIPLLKAQIDKPHLRLRIKTKYTLKQLVAVREKHGIYRVAYTIYRREGVWGRGRIQRLMRMVVMMMMMSGKPCWNWKKTLPVISLGKVGVRPAAPLRANAHFSIFIF